MVMKMKTMIAWQTVSRVFTRILFLMVLFMSIGCSLMKDFLCEVKDRKEKKVPPLVSIPRDNWPDWNDDLDQESLLAAISQSLEYLNRLPKGKVFPYGSQAYSAEEMIQTIKFFAELVNLHGLNSAEFKQALLSNFEVYQATGTIENKGSILFTGYYEPQLEGSPVESHDFPWPLYRRPDDLIEIKLENFHSRFSGEKIVARYDNGKILPYYSREEIDTKGVLKGKGYEFLWLKDSIDAFFLQVQGSGQIKINNHEVIKVGYAAANGHPYRSIGKLLVEKGLMEIDKVSLQSLKEFLLRNPSESETILNHNPSYVFFSILDKGPVGSLNVELTPGRSVAADVMYPHPGLAYVVSRKPVFNTQGELTGWQSFARFVFLQDTGGAIKGPGRIDVFWGTGKEAELSAGHMRQEGRLYFLGKGNSK